MVNRSSKPKCVANIDSRMSHSNRAPSVLSPVRYSKTIRLTLLICAACVVGCESSSDEQYQSYADAAKPERKEPARIDETAVANPAKFEAQTQADTAIVPVVATKPVASSKTVKQTSTSKASYRVLVSTRKFREEDEKLRISYDDLDLLKILGMDEVKPGAEKYFPDWLQELDGKRIVLRGFMYPPYSETGIKRFAFARDNQICCFGRNPKIYDLFLVTLKDGETTDYIANRPFDVAGTFHIEPVVEDGELLQMYEIRNAVVIDK